MADHTRSTRLAERIKTIVAAVLANRVKDPRLGFVTVTDVRVSGDNQHASVFYTVLGDEEEHAATASALASARGLIRSEVGRQTGVRLTPTIDFYLDSVPTDARHLEDALAEAARRDAELNTLRTGARYAGEPDPYRHPEEVGEAGPVDGPATAGPDDADT